MVYTPEGEPSFWMAPFLVKNSACGFAYVELSGKVSKLGIFGSTPEDRPSWVDASFLRIHPMHSLLRFGLNFQGQQYQSLFFSYDTSPARWAWRIEIKNKIKSIIFITPGGGMNNNRRIIADKDISNEG